jgi:1,2-phenylacetyl-CoA epoxidase catalytic subunit
MDDRYYQTLKQMIESQAYRELAAAHLFGYGLQFVPHWEGIEFITGSLHEEIEHYEAVRKMYMELAGEDMTPGVVERVAKRPVPFANSWFELAMAAFLYDRGGYWQLKEYEDCSFLPYRQIIRSIIGDEEGHQGIGERNVIDLCRAGGYDQVKQTFFEKWIRYGLLSFGRPRTEGNRFAISVGLKKRDSGEVMQDFINNIKPAVKACGLIFPTPEAMELEMPDWIDWSLDDVKPATPDR